MAPSVLADSSPEWTILPIAIPTSASYTKPVVHNVYVQPHRPRIPTPHDAQNLFLVNIPIDSTAPHFRAIFTKLVGAGRFMSIAFYDGAGIGLSTARGDPAPLKDDHRSTKKNKRKHDAVAKEQATDLPQVWDREIHHSGSTAIVRLVDEKAARAALKAIHTLGKTSGKVVWGEGLLTDVPALGSARYLKHHKLRYPPVADLQASVDAFMTAFNTREADTARAAKRARNEPDEDGFVTVSRGGRTGPARMEEAERKRDEMRDKEEKRKKEMGNFYRFQGREKRKEEVSKLRREFEEDRKKVETLRERKGKAGFRPEQ